MLALEPEVVKVDQDVILLWLSWLSSSVKHETLCQKLMWQSSIRLHRLGRSLSMIASGLNPQASTEGFKTDQVFDSDTSMRLTWCAGVLYASFQQLVFRQAQRFMRRLDVLYDSCNSSSPDDENQLLL